MLSVSTATATVSNKLETITTSFKYVVATATAAAGDHVTGDVGIELTPDLSQSLTDIAIEKCGTPSKRMKRSATFASCALNFAEEATNGGSAPLGAEGAPTLPSVLAGDIGDVIAAGKAAGVITEANVGVYTVALIALEAFFANAAAGKAAHVPLNLIIPTAALKPATTAKTAATQTTSSSSTSSCPAQNSGKVVQSKSMSYCSCDEANEY